ncbi:MAG TPA: hypothetical protein VK982_05835, partial [Bacteroidales bacterium]|nr:hypothetical protein [Bacteroidales bacterium]
MSVNNYDIYPLKVSNYQQDLFTDRKTEVELDLPVKVKGRVYIISSTLLNQLNNIPDNELPNKRYITYEKIFKFIHRINDFISDDSVSINNYCAIP